MEDSVYVRIECKTSTRLEDRRANAAALSFTAYILFANIEFIFIVFEHEKENDK